MPGSPAPVSDRFATRRERRDQRWPLWLKSLAHPFELVPGAEAGDAFEAARTRGQAEGFCPLIVQTGFDLPVRAKPISLKDSKVRTADEYFEWNARTFAENTDNLALFEAVEEVAPTLPQGLYMIDMLSTTRPLSIYNEVAILRLPCAESWKIPLFLDVGPPASDSGRSRGEEIGIQRQWYERFGAELYCIGERSWQFRVSRPPRSHAEAVDLLRQHYLYAWIDDAYDEETIANGAAQLRVDTHWMFFRG
jgi:Domain of unknown function (DUF4253)